MNRDKNLMLILCNIIAFLLNLKHVYRLSRDPCVNACDFKFGSKISLCGPETVRNTHSSSSGRKNKEILSAQQHCVETDCKKMTS